MVRQMPPADASLATASMIKDLHCLASTLPRHQQPGLHRR